MELAVSGRRGPLARLAQYLALGTLMCGAPAERVSAQADPSDAGPQANYAFSTQLGSGVYRSHGSTVQVYRLAFGIGLRSLEGHRWGLDLRLPVTFGFYDFDLASVLESGLPDGLTTLAVAPELRFDIPVRERWRLMPFGALGVGRDFSAGRMSYIAATGTRSLVGLDWRSVHLLVGNRLLYAAYTTSELGFGDDFAGLESGLDARHSIGFSIAGHRVDAGPFFMHYLYFLSPDLAHFVGESLSIEQQWEIGATLGTMTPWRVLGLEMPRVGVGYRFGSGTSIVRIVLGGAFN
ncbi:MAG TPA: hypothetical protein VLA09_01030 [Longimicrobiales bacterium]|nr:hypothetical protein [Longimicrobiales bacterium]